jgi:hypothetical protein
MASPAKRELVSDREAQVLSMPAPSDPAFERMHAPGNSASDGSSAVPAAKERLGDGTLYELDPIRDSRWATLVAGHHHSSVFHSQSWLRALHDVHGYESVVVSTCSPTQDLTNGIVFSRVASWLTGRRLVSLPFSDHCEPLVDSTAQLETLLTHMKGRVRQERWKYFEIRPVSSEPKGHADLSRTANYYFHNLDLRPTTEQLFHNFHRDCIQRKIRRAEREKLQYEEGTSEELLTKFYCLLVMTRRRQYLPPQPLSWFRGLIAALGADLQIRVASKDGRPVASILTLSHKKTMVYKYGCSNVAFNNLGGTPFLFWRTIQDAKDRGFEQLEMGRSDMDNQGLVAFKERLGASRRSLSYWRYPQIDLHGFGSWKNTIAKRVVPLMPDLALETIGKLLYRHIG